MSTNSRKLVLTALRRAHRTVFALLRPSSEVIFLLGHMRSGSSLLAHVLASHSSIVGVGETHTRYDGPESFADLWFEVARLSRRYPHNVRFVLDKILHNEHIRRPGLLSNPRVHCVFILREPMGTIASLIARLDFCSASNPEPAVRYYIERLAELSRWAQQASRSRPPCLILYDELLAEPEGVLQSLSRGLGLSPPLSPEYRTIPATGHWGIGDGSENISAGRIFDPDRLPQIALSKEQRERASEAFSATAAGISRLCAAS